MTTRRLPRPALAGAALVAACALSFAGSSPTLASSHQPTSLEHACPQFPAGTVPPPSFRDVEGNPHRHAIACMDWYGITKGVTPERYAPEELVRRDQMATFLARMLAALRVPLPEPGDRFDDVGPVHADNVERLAAAGVTVGTGPRTYSPELPLSRAQMASLLRRTYDYASTAFPSSETGQDYFSDDARSIHQGEINRGYANGFFSGVQEPAVRDDGTVAEQGRFAPLASVRRDQMATFLGRAMGRAVLFVPGSTNDPYLRDTPVPLVDRFILTVVGSDQDAEHEVRAFDQNNPPPDSDHRFVLFRVRVTNGGERTTTFFTDSRLVARNVGVTPSGPVFPATGSPCGRIPDPLGEPELEPSAVAEGNVCFEVRSFSFATTNLVDTALGKPTNPHLTGFNQRKPLGGSERSPYAPS